jgi:hypothetical protein
MKCTDTQCTGMQCSEAKELFSPYLDGAVTGTQMQGLQNHLSECAGCRREYHLLRQTQQILTSARRPKAPADLGLKLRLAISREAAQAKQPPFQGLLVRLENALHAFMVPVTAGFLSALVIFAVAMAYFVGPSPLQANNDDVPLIMVNTAPELEQSAFNMSRSTIDSDSLVIEADIDSRGRVQDYKILSDPKDSDKLLPQVKQMLIFTTFRPALSMGQPAPGRAVLSFSKMSNRG